MHEMSIAVSIVEVADEAAAQAGAERVTQVRCRVGTLRQIDEDLLQDAFEVARAGTRCSTARLLIETVPAMARCLNCGAEYGVRGWEWNCAACGEQGLPLGGGDELEVIDLEAETPA